VGTWGGFVFINPDPAAGPLEDHLGELPQHFEKWPLEQRFKAVHVAKIFPTNWKVVQEAFMEAFHVVATHPQLLASIGDANTDVLRTTFPNYAPYMLTPIMIMETMANQHGVTTGDDVSKLLSPLSQPLTSLSDLTKHMSSFLLASQRLTRSGQGKTAYT
jgi:phenylpropionate dioxygenase-like ring-hydroxylating dioxygenase large terminal subunit